MKLSIFVLTVAIFISAVGCGRTGSHMPLTEQDQTVPTGVQTKLPLFTFDRNIVPIFKKRCSLCHNGQGLPDWTVYKNSFAKRQEIAKRIGLPSSNPQSMPLGNNNTGMTDSERSLILEWIQGGAPHLDKNGKPI